MGLNEILMKLTLKGVDPSEAQRIASSSMASLETELRAGLARQADLFKTAAETQNAQSRAYAQREIKDNADKMQVLMSVAKQNDDAIQRMGKAQAAAMVEDAAREVAARKTVDDAFHQNIETMKNLAELAFISFETIKGGYEKFKVLGEEVIRTSGIFASLGISIEDARVHTHGMVADIDLLSARNRAAEMDLKLTGEQFGKVAGSAEEFARAVGIDTKEALDQLVVGLATGRLRTLAHAGIVIDTTKAYDDFAKSIGTTTDQLDAEQKKLAIQTEAFVIMDKKMAESGEHALTFAMVLKGVFVDIKNTWDHTLATIGNIKMGDMGVKSLASQELTAVGAPTPGMVDSTATAQIRAHNAAILAARQKMRDQLHEQLAGMDPSLASAGGDISMESWQHGGGDAGDAWMNPIGSGLDTSGLKTSKTAKGTQYDLLADYMRAAAMRLANAQIVAENTQQDALGLLNQPFDELAGKFKPVEEGLAEKQTDVAIAKQRMQFAGGTYTLDEQKHFEAAQGKSMEKITPEVRRQLEGIGDEFSDINGVVTEKQGLISKLLFGEDEPHVMFDHMTEAQQELFRTSQIMEQSFQMVGKAGHQMAGAIGKSLAAAIGEHAAFGGMLKEQTHQVLMALSTQAFERGAFELAEGLASLALGPIGGVSAGMHFAAAAAFGAVGIGAGLGARATYTPPAASAGSAPTVPNVGSGSSAGSGSGSSGSQAPAPINIVIHVNPGGEAETGRALIQSLTAYGVQNGVDVSKLLNTI